MNFYIRLLFFSLNLQTFVLIVICGKSGKREKENEATKFDFLTFAQMWPITDCELWEWADPSNTCNLPKESNYLKHYYMLRNLQPRLLKVLLKIFFKLKCSFVCLHIFHYIDTINFHF